MLKLSSKRSHDMIIDAPPPPCSPHRIQFLGSPPSPPSPFKRVRTSPAVEAQSRKHSRDESPFAPAAPFNPNVAERFVPRKKQRAEEGEKLYTLEEVKRIVAQVVAERENALREEYTQTLQQKLEEQFNLFSNFAQDNIARQLRENDTCSYIG